MLRQLGSWGRSLSDGIGRSLGRLRLTHTIVLWVSIATVVPLSLLTLGATAYSERLYLAAVDEDASAGLSTLVSEIDRRLLFDREMILALARVPALEGFLPVLEQASRGDLHPESFERGDRLTRFLVGFQNVIPGIATVRVLDLSLNTLIRVQLGAARRSAHPLDGLLKADQALDEPKLLQRLQDLPAGEVSFLWLPSRDLEPQPAILHAVVPLANADEQRVGFLVTALSGGHTDRILDLATPPYHGQLLIVEANPDDPQRDGMVLYDAGSDVRFASFQRPAFGDLYGTALWSELQRGPFGTARESAPGERVYFQEYHPYPNELLSWMVAMRVDVGDLSAPFQRIRRGILLFSGLTIGLILVLARVGAQRIAAPIGALGTSLTAYANGQRDVHLRPTGPQEIRQLQAAFNHMVESIEAAERARDRAQRLMLQSAKLASVGQMAAGIGHEINNPLNHILSLTKLMERALPSDDAVRSDLASLRDEALRCSRIVAGVLDFARQAPPCYERFEVAPWVDRTLELVRHSARRGGVRLEASASAGGTVDGDPNQLRQVLVNLLLNAIQASPRGGIVAVEVEDAADCIELRVRDQGPGIPEELLDQVFDPFFSTKPDGTGLGLSISMGLVERHGGSLQLRNDPAGGGCASIMLPRERQVDAEDCKKQGWPRPAASRPQ